MRTGNWELGPGKRLFAAALVLACAPATCQQSMRGLDFSIGTKPGGEITAFDSLSRIEAAGWVHIEAVSKPAGTSLVADSEKMTVIRFSDPRKKGALSGLDSIKSAIFSGSVKMVYIAPKPVTDETGKKTGEVMTRIEATSDNAAFDGATGIVTLTGNVKIIQDDPSMWAEPAVMTGDKATVNLKRTPGAGDYDFKIESINCPSRIEVVPRAES